MMIRIKEILFLFSIPFLATFFVQDIYGENKKNEEVIVKIKGYDSKNSVVNDESMAVYIKKNTTSGNDLCDLAELNSKTSHHQVMEFTLKDMSFQIARDGSSKKCRIQKPMLPIPDVSYKGSETEICNDDGAECEFGEEISFEKSEDILCNDIKVSILKGNQIHVSCREVNALSSEGNKVVDGVVFLWNVTADEILIQTRIWYHSKFRGDLEEMEMLSKEGLKLQKNKHVFLDQE